jgi:hypothetical protein
MSEEFWGKPVDLPTDDDEPDPTPAPGSEPLATVIAGLLFSWLLDREYAASDPKISDALHTVRERVEIAVARIDAAARAEAAAAATAREARLRNALDVAHGKLDLIATTRDRTSRGPIRDALAGMAAIERALATPEDGA